MDTQIDILPSCYYIFRCNIIKCRDLFIKMTIESYEKKNFFFLNYPQNTAIKMVTLIVRIKELICWYLYNMTGEYFSSKDYTNNQSITSF